MQIDESYRTNKYGAGMLHVISSTSTNITYKLAFYFLQSARQVDLTWILKTILEQSIIINPGVIITDADLTLINAIDAVFPQAHHQLCFWHIRSNIKASHQRNFPSIEVEGGHPLDVFCVFKDVVAFSLGYNTSRSI